MPKKTVHLFASPNAERLHHDFFDPSKLVGTDQEKHAAFLKARTEIKDYMKAFVRNVFRKAFPFEVFLLRYFAE